MSDSRHFTMPQIAAATGLGKTTVQRRANRERWPYSVPPCGYRTGNPARLFAAAELPADVRSALERRPPLELPVGNDGPLGCSTPGCGRTAEAIGLCAACRTRKRTPRAGRPGFPKGTRAGTGF